MKKISLLAASVALALVGCGGSDGDSSTASAGGIVITGFDGYFKNAVVFNDVNNNGVLDVNVDTVFGLTDKLGQITLPKDTVIKGSIALQTLKPGDVKKELAKKLAALSPAADTFSDFMNTYTTDTDHEGQPMANAVVFRAPVSSEAKTAVISPLTDLVAIEMARSTTEKPVSEKEAIEKVTAALGGTTEQPIDLFSDFVKDSKTNLASAKLHKTAQILTESKAKNPEVYEQNSAKIAAVAQEKSKDIVTDKTMGTDDLLNQKPVIDPSIPDVIITNYKLLVNEDAKIAIQKEISALAIAEGQSLNTPITIPANLFQDKYGNDTDGNDTDFSDVQVIASIINGNGEIAANLVGETLTLSAENLQPTSDTYTITLKAEDKATADTEVLNTLSTTFSFKVEMLNTAPIVDTDTKESIQDLVDSWKLQQGAAFSQTFSVDGLFNDREGDALTYTTNINSVVSGLTSTFNQNTNEITISGKPQPKHLGQLVFTITADDGHPATRMASEAANFTLPAIEAGEITINTNAKAELQAKAAAWTLKVGTKFNQTLNISDLFDSGVSGDTEYYAHYTSKDKEVGNNIPGVKVTVDDNSGVVTLTGTPTEKTNGVMLYVAKRIKFSDDKGDYIESEMVNITLPNVKPADEVTPPPQPDNNVSMENMFLYESAVESLDEENNNYLGSGVSCEVRYFMSDGENTGTGEMFSFTRTAESFEECPTIDKDTQPTIENGFESFGEYKVNNNHVISLQIEEEGYDESGEPLMEKVDITLSAKMFDKKFITTHNEKITPPEGHGDVRTWKSLYAASTTPASANAIMAQWNRWENGNINKLENTVYFTGESVNIQPLSVSATMNSVETCTGDPSMCESGNTDADIYIKNMSCELVEKVYSFNGYSTSNPQINWTQFNFYPYHNDDNSCVVDFTSYSDISLGIHTLHGEVKEAFQGKYQDIMFSFKKD